MITIIGAGPAGCRTGELLAKKGEEVRILEEHATIGEPQHCTGILTKEITRIIKLPKELVLNRINKILVHSPSGKIIDIKTDETIVDRPALDSWLSQKAIDAGANIITGIKAEKIQRKKDRIQVFTSDGRIETDKLIGAEGPQSITSRFLNNPIPRSWIGVQGIADVTHETNAYSVYLSNEIPGFFGWVVPINNSEAKVGIACERNPAEIFKKFAALLKLRSGDVHDMHGGLIPRYDPNLTLESEGVYLVGDAATQVKATTGGGVVPGLIAAGCLAESINKGGDYKKSLSGLRKDLWASLFLRKMIDRLSEKDLDRLVGYCGEDRLKKILQSETRDAPRKLIFKSIIAQPKLLLFSKAFIPAKRL